jgi:hypothetical protein
MDRATTLYSGDRRIRTMMQPCASAAKLRSSGSILHIGPKAMVLTSDHRHLGSLLGAHTIGS